MEEGVGAQTLDPGSPAAGGGSATSAIRNLFIIPTIVFLIVFNIFPLIYSLGYSFTDFRASSNAPANFVGLQNYRDLLNDEHVWNNFSVTAKYVLVSVGGQVLVGFGVALLLNRKIPFKGFITTLLLLPMMMSHGRGRPVLGAALQPVLGHHQLRSGAGGISLAVQPRTWRSMPSPSPTSGCGRRS